jgi:hypothetical protein
MECTRWLLGAGVAATAGAALESTWTSGIQRRDERPSLWGGSNSQEISGGGGGRGGLSPPLGGGGGRWRSHGGGGGGSAGVGRGGN